MWTISNNNRFHIFAPIALAAACVLAPQVSPAIDYTLKLQDKYKTAEWMNRQHLFDTVPLWGTNAVWSKHFSGLEESVHLPAKNRTMTNTLFRSSVINKAYPNKIYGEEGDIEGDEFLSGDPPQSVWYPGGRPRLSSICRSVNGIDAEKGYLAVNEIDLDDALGIPLTGISWYASSYAESGYSPLATMASYVRSVWPDCSGLDDTYDPKIVDKYSGEADSYLVNDPYAEAMFRSVDVSAPYSPLPLYGYFVPYLNGVKELSSCHHIFRYLAASAIDIKQVAKYYTIEQQITYIKTNGPISGHTNPTFDEITDVLVSEPEVSVRTTTDTTRVPYFTQSEFSSYAYCDPTQTTKDFTGDMFGYIVKDGAIRDLTEYEGSVADRSRYQVVDCHIWWTGKPTAEVNDFDTAWTRSWRWKETIRYTTILEWPVLTTDNTRLTWDFDTFPPTPFPTIEQAGYSMGNARAVALCNVRLNDESSPYAYTGESVSWEDPKLFTMTNWNWRTGEFLKDVCQSVAEANSEIVDAHKLGPSIYDSIPQYYDQEHPWTNRMSAAKTHIVYYKNEGGIAGVCADLRTGGQDLSLGGYSQYETDEGIVYPQYESYGGDLWQVTGYVCDTNKYVMPSGEWRLKSWVNVSPFFSYEVLTPQFNP